MTHALTLLILAVILALTAAPAAAQRGRPGSPDPLGEVIDRAQRPAPAAPAPEAPIERVVPERRERDPISGREIVIPSHTERSISGSAVQVPPLTGYDAGTGAPVHLPGGIRPPADERQGP